MRLGAFACEVKKKSKLFDAYDKDLIFERHRHRYEFNDKYLKSFEENGLKAVGVNLAAREVPYNRRHLRTYAMPIPSNSAMVLYRSNDAIDIFPWLFC